MQKFEIASTAMVDNEKGYLLNKPFRIRVKDSNFSSGKISSYHQPCFNEPDWMIYPSLPSGHIALVASKEAFTSEEALSFMGQQNGIGLTRDNLFMLPHVFPHFFEPLKVDVCIVAFMNKELLPNHLNGEAICPMLTVTNDPRWLDYDWHFYDWNQSKEHRAGLYFVFLMPLLRKPYY